MAAMRSKTDIELELAKEAATDPKRTSTDMPSVEALELLQAAIPIPNRRNGSSSAANTKSVISKGNDNMVAATSNRL